MEKYLWKTLRFVTFVANPPSFCPVVCITHRKRKRKSKRETISDEDVEQTPKEEDKQKVSLPRDAPSSSLSQSSSSSAYVEAEEETTAAAEEPEGEEEGETSYVEIARNDSPDNSVKSYVIESPIYAAESDAEDNDVKPVIGDPVFPQDSPAYSPISSPSISPMPPAIPPIPESQTPDLKPSHIPSSPQSERRISSEIAETSRPGSSGRSLSASTSSSSPFPTDTKSDAIPEPEDEDISCFVRITGLGPSATVSSLEEVLGPYGEIIRIELKPETSGISHS